MINPLSDNTCREPALVIPFTSSNGNSCCESSESNSTNVSVVVTPTGTNVVRGIIKFTNVASVQLLNYNTTLKQIYGNNLIALQIFQTGYTEDKQTPATITYATPNDPTTDIISIVWNYPFPVSGYILIVGIFSATEMPSGLPVFTFTEASLVQDINGIWYLPLILPIGLKPFYVEINGDQLDGSNYQRSTSRLYGFANNNPQSISVYIQ